VKLVRAIRKGWISLEKPKEKPKYYMLWGDDLQAAERTANGLAYIAAPKPKLPGKFPDIDIRQLLDLNQ
jgi:ribosome biogenesis protein ERB1